MEDLCNAFIPYILIRKFVDFRVSHVQCFKLRGDVPKLGRVHVKYNFKGVRGGFTAAADDL